MDLKQLRRTHRLTQEQFWSRVGHCQSAGSRYEAGRRIPTPTARLITLAYGTDRQVRRCMSYLRTGRAA